MTDASSVYHKARGEVASMLGFTDLDNLSAEQSTRLDIGTSLRVLLDHQSGRLLRGESLDARELLMASDALAKILPPAALAAPPDEANAPDPRQIMFDNYMGMRRRAVPAISEHGILVDSLRASLIGLAEEIEQAKDAALSDVPALVETVPAPAPSNVVPLQPKPSSAASAAPAPVPQPLLRGPDEPWRAFYGDNSRWEV
jgi:hypothetical protein